MRLVLLMLVAWPASGRAAEREQIIAAAREIIDSVRYCALVTLDADGQPRVRVMDPFGPDDGMVIWLGTNARSRKVNHVRGNPQVALHYFARDPDRYVTINGTAQLIDDAQEMTRYWKPEWSDFYPHRDKDFLLIKVLPRSLEVFSPLHGIAGDPETWTLPVVDFPEGR